MASPWPPSTAASAAAAVLARSTREEEEEEAEVEALPASFLLEKKCVLRGIGCPGLPFAVTEAKEDRRRRSSNVEEGDMVVIKKRAIAWM